jgi:hypothetical protein
MSDWSHGHEWNLSGYEWTWESGMRPWNLVEHHSLEECTWWALGILVRVSWESPPSDEGDQIRIESVLEYLVMRRNVIPRNVSHLRGIWRVFWWTMSWTTWVGRGWEIPTTYNLDGVIGTLWLLVSWLGINFVTTWKLVVHLSLEPSCYSLVPLARGSLFLQDTVAAVGYVSAIMGLCIEL